MSAVEKAQSRVPDARRLLLACATLVGTTLLVVLAVELGLRASGRGPRQLDPRLANHPPKMLAPHDTLGWINEPGDYRFPAYQEGLPEIHMTFWDGGFRATAPRRQPRDRRILLLGGSCIQGMALSDEQTFGWRVQQAYPEHEVLNAGVGGYGTYQSLLRLEESARTWEEPPEVVVYGFATFHGIRNVGHHSWLRNLIRRDGKDGTVATPYATLAPEGFSRHPPESFPTWPLERSLATVYTIERAWMRMLHRGRRESRIAVTYRLLQEMQRVGERWGTTLIVMQIDTHPAWNTAEHLATSGIRHVDAAHPDFGQPGYIVPNEGHPNGAVAAFWLEHVRPELDAVVRPG